MRSNAPNAPAVSVLLPVYNGERFLRQCIESVLCQTHTDFELLVGDDRSDDSSMDVIAEFRDARLRLIENDETRRGLFGNLNRLLAAARAPIVQMLCQDDFLEHTCLHEVVSFFHNHPTVGMLFAKFFEVDQDGRPVSRCALNDLPDVMDPSEALQHFFYHGCVAGNLSSVAVRKAAFDAVGPFDRRFTAAGDYDMWVRICEAFPMGVIHRHLLSVRRHSKRLSLSRDAGSAFIPENALIRQRLMLGFPEAVRATARRFEQRRHAVLDAHDAVRSLLARDYARSAQIVRTWGWRKFALALWFWAISLDNRLYRPRPHFVNLASR